MVAFATASRNAIVIYAREITLQPEVCAANAPTMRREVDVRQPGPPLLKRAHRCHLESPKKAREFSRQSVFELPL
jgi:hypothetical protein